jgi:cellulose synthase/poly-beta-1,6-N-acetylglucosamine synthase-like glycosyltransferase
VRPVTAWATVLFWTLLSLAAVQVVAVVEFVRATRHRRWAGPKAGYCPKTAVILCLRGADPFLPACLDGILTQDYPCYDVHIVVDSLDDPAWPVAHQAVARRGATHVRIQPLTDRRQTCSLKCSSLVQAISQLDAPYEVVALLDADVVPHASWLRELVAPLGDPDVGAATGNRWYSPGSVSWGSLVRWQWNAAAVVLMTWGRIPWGGTLAVKRDVLMRSRAPERWAHAFCEDTLLYGELRRLGYRVAFVPSLMMVNREGCTLTAFCGWVRRQLLAARFYHPAWGMVAAHGLTLSATQLVALVSMGAALGLGHGQAAAWTAAGLGAYWTVMAILLAATESAVRRTRVARGGLPRWIRPGTLPRIAAAMLLTQAIYAGMLLSALFVRTVTWRGIRYSVEGPGRIRLIEYRPHRECPRPRHSPESL